MNMRMQKNVKRGLLPYLFLFIILIGVMFFMNSMNNKVNNITYDEFMSKASEGLVKEIKIVPRSRASVYEVKGKLYDTTTGDAYLDKDGTRLAIITRS